MKFNSIAISFAILTLTGCKNIFENDDFKPDGSMPFTKMASPAEGNVYHASEPLNLKGDIADKDDIKQLDVSLVRINGENGSENVINFQRKPDIHLYQLDTTIAANSLAPGNYQLSIRAIDGRTNEATKQVNFSVN